MAGSNQKGSAEYAGLQSLVSARRLLLATDDVLAGMLEAACLESIVAQPVRHRIVTAAERMELLKLEAGAMLLNRDVVLTGSHTHTPLVYSEAVVALDRLTAPDGEAWSQVNGGFRKELLHLRQLPASRLSSHLGVEEGHALLARTSRVHAFGRPAGMLTEYFADDLMELLTRTDDCGPSEPGPRPDTAFIISAA